MVCASLVLACAALPVISSLKQGRIARPCPLHFANSTVVVPACADASAVEVTPCRSWPTSACSRSPTPRGIAATQSGLQEAPYALFFWPWPGERRTAQFLLYLYGDGAVHLQHRREEQCNASLECCGDLAY